MYEFIMHFSKNLKQCTTKNNYIYKQNAYTVAFSGGVTNGGVGYFSSNVWVITSESGTHFSSNFMTGTLPSGLTLRNLNQQNKL